MLQQSGFVDRETETNAAHYRHGFAWPDGKFRFSPIWEETSNNKNVEWVCDPSVMPKFADHWDVNEQCDDTHPFRLATSPARAFLNTTFNETPGSQKREGATKAFIHPRDAETLGISTSDQIQLGNKRGEVTLKAEIFDGIQTCVVIV